jgi:2-hydroxy-6-oxonona-2,4-dienedioate hydrolase
VEPKVMDYDVKQEQGFKYIETCPGKPVLLLLHGLFGALSNFKGILHHFDEKINVVVPILPIFELPITEVSLEGLVKHIKKFVDFKNIYSADLLGNSLGGHLAILYTLDYPEQVRSLTLTGSSGLFESAMGTSFPKRGDYDFIKNKTELTFYDPAVADKELVDEVFNIVNDRMRGLRIVLTAKSAMRNNVEDKVSSISCPTLLVWGKEDNITPAFVGERFNELIPKSELVLLDKCGHAPMMEHPSQFNEILDQFLTRVHVEAYG